MTQDFSTFAFDSNLGDIEPLPFKRTVSGGLPFDMDATSSSAAVIEPLSHHDEVCLDEFADYIEDVIHML